ncbi:hypothetical protein BHM03_00035002 [Ensete ventricosum]|nr:hypothetical protein BHM03_00035002 [Ensete ventricosum]
MGVEKHVLAVFISIDCGMANGNDYVDSQTGLSYASDYQYTDAGINHISGNHTFERFHLPTAGFHGVFDASSVWKAVDVAINCTARASGWRPAIADVVTQLTESLQLEIIRHNHGY